MSENEYDRMVRLQELVTAASDAVFEARMFARTFRLQRQNCDRMEECFKKLHLVQISVTEAVRSELAHSGRVVVQ